MRETTAELAELQALIDRSHARSQMAGIIHPGKYSLTAAKVVIFRSHYGSSAFDWSERGVYVRLDADRFFTYSRKPDAFPA